MVTINEWYNRGMKLNQLDPWQVTPMEGIAIQERLDAKVSFGNGISSPVSHIAGVDIS